MTITGPHQPWQLRWGLALLSPVAAICMGGAAAMAGFLMLLVTAAESHSEGDIGFAVLMGLFLAAGCVMLAVPVCALLGISLLSGVSSGTSSHPSPRWRVRVGSSVAMFSLVGVFVLSDASSAWARPMTFICMAVFLVTSTAVANLLASHIESIPPTSIETQRPRAGTVRLFGPGFAMAIVGVGAVCGIAATLFEQAGESDGAEWLYLPFGIACIMCVMVVNSLLREASALRGRLKSSSAG